MRLFLFFVLLCSTITSYADCCWNIIKDYPPTNSHTTIGASWGPNNIQISWSTNNTTIGCTASSTRSYSNWSGKIPTSGTVNIDNINSNDTFTLTCGNQVMTCPGKGINFCSGVTNNLPGPNPPYLLSIIENTL